MDAYQKGYSDAQHLIAQKFVKQVLTEYPLSTEWERVASVTGLTKEEVIAAIKEGKKIPASFCKNALRNRLRWMKKLCVCWWKDLRPFLSIKPLPSLSLGSI